MPLSPEQLFPNPLTLTDPSINPYVGKLLAGKADGTLPLLVGDEASAWRGKWREKFFASFHTPPLIPDSRQRLIVEIGCHKGDLITNIAKDHPAIGFIGLDITYKRVVMTAERAVSRQTKNVQSVMANAMAMTRFFDPGELDGVMVFYPDPWAKRTEAKKRLLKAEFLSSLKQLIRPGGFFWLKTDQKEYFGGVCELVDQLGFRRVTTISSLIQQDYLTTFEKKFKIQNLPTYEQKWEL